MSLHMNIRHVNLCGLLGIVVVDSIYNFKQTNVGDIFGLVGQIFLHYLPFYID